MKLESYHRVDNYRIFILVHLKIVLNDLTRLTRSGRGRRTINIQRQHLDFVQCILPDCRRS